MEKKLNLPNAKDLRSMRPDELTALLKVLDNSLMSAGGRKIQGNAVGGTRENEDHKGADPYHSERAVFEGLKWSPSC